MAVSQSKRMVNPWGDDHPEKLNQKSSDQLGWKDQLKGLVNPSNFVDQLFGRQSTHESPQHQSETNRVTRRNEEIIFSRTTRETEHALAAETKQILDQLKQQVTLLEKAEKSLAKEISKVKVEQLPKKAQGIYFIRFLEWLLTEVRNLRIKAEEGSAWLQTFNSKRKKKAGYWQMYKKHGTTFGLSNERTLATQTG